MSKLIFAIAALGIFSGAVLAQQPASTPSKNYRAEYVLIRLEHVENEIERLLASIDTVQEKIDNFELTIAGQMASLQKTRSNPCTPEEFGDGSEKAETQAEANRRCQEEIEETESNIRSNTAKRDFHERRRMALANRLNAQYSLRDQLEREIAGTPYEAH